MRLNHQSVNKSSFYFFSYFFKFYEKVCFIVNKTLLGFYVELLQHIPECYKQNGIRCREKISGVSDGRRLSKISNQTRLHSPTP